MKFKFKNNFQYIPTIINLYREAGGFILKASYFILHKKYFRNYGFRSISNISF